MRDGVTKALGFVMANGTVLASVGLVAAAFGDRTSPTDLPFRIVAAGFVAFAVGGLGIVGEVTGLFARWAAPRSSAPASTSPAETSTSRSIRFGDQPGT